MKPRRMWLTLLGALVLGLGLLDIFFTVLQYDGYGFLSARAYRGMWSVVKAIARLLPGKKRAFVLSLGAPLMIPMSIGLWLALVVFGSALIYLPGMHSGAVNLAEGLEPSLTTALYFSGTVVSTLGFGDVTATTAFYELVSIMQALTGFAILTLTISYVLNIYRVLQHQSVVGASLHHKAQDRGDYDEVARLYLRAGTQELSRYLETLHRDLTEEYEALRRYPIVYYFYSRRPYRSLPYVFRMIGYLTASLSWGLPDSHRIRRDPWLAALRSAYVTITGYIGERFVRREMTSNVEPVEFATFESCLRGNERLADTYLAEFLEMQERMFIGAGIDESPDPHDSYDRYRGSLPFMVRARAFTEATAGDLGYRIEEIREQPGGQLY